MSSDPNGLYVPRSGADSEPIIVDQAIFGYGHGHQLLESTTSFDDSSRLRLDRLTDGSGAEALADFNGYLSGFPLPDGRYVFTRTWKATKAKRPGSVWTHAAILDRDTVSRLSDPGPVIGLLRLPSSALSSSNPLKRMRVLADSGSPIQGSDLLDWNAVVTALTSSDSMTVGVTLRTARDAEASLRALWAWFWPALRNGFAFSLGATARGSLEKGRHFDLVGIPAGVHVSGEGIVVDPRGASRAGTAIWSEVASLRTGDLSQYVRFCGAETNRRTAAAVLTNVWNVATNAELDRDARQLALAEAVVEAFPAAAAMRRLKRSVFTENGRLPVAWDRATTLEILAAPKVAQCVLADDVELNALVQSASSNPSLLVHAYDSLASASAALPLSARNQFQLTVLNRLPDAAELAISQYAVPEWLSDLAAASPRLAMGVLRDAPPADRRDWAGQFWALHVDEQDRVSGAYLDSVREVAPGSIAASVHAETPRTAGWLAAFAPTTSGGANWLATCHPNERSRRAAMIDFASVLPEQGPVSHAWIGAVHDRNLVQSGVKAATTDAVSAVGAATLLYVIDPEVGAASHGRLKTWAKVLGVDLDGVSAAHLLRYAQRAEPPAEVEVRLLAKAFCEAWNALARRDAATWDALGDFPADAEAGGEWDRAYRLTSSLASLIRSWRLADPHFDSSALLALTHQLESKAAEQLDAVLRNRAPAPKPSRVGRPEVVRRGRLDPLRQLADEIRSMLGF